MATPKQKSKATLIGHSDSHEHVDIQVTDIHNIDHLESAYRAAGMHERFLLDKEEMMRRKIQDERRESSKALMLEDPQSDTSGSVYEDAETELESESQSPQSSHLKKSVRKRPGYKRDPFVAPKYPKESWTEENARTSAALDQVHPSVHTNSKEKRNTAKTLCGQLGVQRQRARPAQIA